MIDSRWGFWIAGYCLVMGIVQIVAGLVAVRKKRSMAGAVGIANLIMLGIGVLALIVMR